MMSVLSGGDAATQFLRICAIYFFTLFMLRIAGKRRIARLSAFDILVIIALGSAVGDVMLYAQDVVALERGAFVVLTVIGLSIIVTKVAEHHKALAYVIYGKGTDIIRSGRIVTHNLEAEDLTEDELMELLREKGVGRVSEVKEAVLERNGELGIILFDSEKSRKGSLRRRSGAF